MAAIFSLAFSGAYAPIDLAAWLSGILDNSNFGAQAPSYKL
jgi:hypothetical protein